MNKVVIAGNFSKDPEVRLVGAKNTHVCDFSLALNAYRGNKKVTYWIDCQAWTKTADNIAKYFKKDMLLEIGFKEDELKGFMTEFEEKFHKESNATCVYPLVPKFSEKYDAVIIVSKNSIDTAFLETVLGIEKCQSYKNSRTGKAMVIDVDKFRKQWEEK